MKVLQLIDSLHPGGAEKMAINLFKKLNENGVECLICSTREEGMLKEEILERNKYLFLQRKSVFDKRAIYRLYRFIKEKHIDTIHAHGTSFFLATIIKLIFRNKISLIWHDHYGNSEFLKDRSYKILRVCSIWFDGVICVNNALLSWCRIKLLANNYLQINNFVNLEVGDEYDLKLAAENSFKLICVANLRPQKNHQLLIEVFKNLNLNRSISLHLFGKEFQDNHSEKIKYLVEQTENVYYYGSKQITKAILSQADVGVLVSKSEGLPLAILEYGIAGLPVICSDVGECRRIIENKGIIIESGNIKALETAIETMIFDDFSRDNYSKDFNKKISEDFDPENSYAKFIDFYKKCSLV